ncbi:MAG: hypothetical protein ACI93R_003075 [Flavobacteriales bacterium]
MDNVEFTILLRKPEYPVIIISVNQLYSAFNINDLARNCVKSIPRGSDTYVKVIDLTGEEFWYTTDSHVLAPGFSFKKWTKKSIIELFNDSLGANNSKLVYSLKSISGKRLDRIIGDICNRLNEAEVCDS